MQICIHFSQLISQTKWEVKTLKSDMDTEEKLLVSLEFNVSMYLRHKDYSITLSMKTILSHITRASVQLSY